jgi:hypothetical protein
MNKSEAHHKDAHNTERQAMKKIARTAFVLFLHFTLCPWCLCGDPALQAAETYYVSPQGSDEAAGSKSAPWKTLQRAVTAAPAGSTLLLREGAYEGPVIVRVANLTIQAYEGEKAIIQTPVKSEKDGNNLWFVAGGGTVRDLELVGGYYYALKFEEGPGLVENCKVHDCGNHGIKMPAVTASKVTIRKCEIFNTGRNTKAGQGIDDVLGDDLMVQDCYIHDTPSYAALAKGGARHCVFERNRIVNCGGGIILGGSTDDDLFDTAANPQKFESIDATARNNIIIDTQYAGISMWKALRPQVYNNTIYHSCLANEHGGILLQLGSQDPTIINNIVVMASGSKRPVVYLKHAVAGTLTMDHNCYWNEGGRASWWDPPKALSDLAAWQKRKGVDKHSLVTDPKIDPKTGFLLPDSPCIDQGQTLSSFQDDFRKRPRPQGATWDIGADQWKKE